MKVRWFSWMGVFASSLALAPTAFAATQMIETGSVAETSAAAQAPAPEPFPPLPEMPAAPAIAPAPVASPEVYAAPDSIIFSERSTGCEMVVQTGQGLTNLCGTVPTPAVSPTSGTTATGLSRFPSQPVALAPSPASRGMTSPIQGTVSSLRDDDYRTYRPPARRGNGNLRLLFPLSIPAPITSLFGWRIHPITGDSRFHSGVDLGAPLGTPVLAALAGRVAIADFLGGYGLTVTLEHANGQQETLYAHLSEIFVKPGEAVKQGEVIGRVGSTGLSTGPHLHFEFRQLTEEGWVALDPGEQLEYGLAQLIQSMQVAVRPEQAAQVPQ
jgi:murein DD-endopeptidase MepM/ murein hydrolase activator NlpD